MYLYLSLMKGLQIKVFWRIYYHIKYEWKFHRVFDDNFYMIFIYRHLSCIYKPI